MKTALGKIRCIIFDFDGVILESINVKKEAFAKVFAAYPDQVDAIVQHHMDHGGLSRFRKFEYIYQEILKESLTEEKSIELGEKFSEYAFEAVIASEFVSGAEEFLKKYHQDLDLYVASGTPHEEMLQVVSRRQLNSYFKGVFGSPTTKGEIIKNILSDEKIEPDEAVMVGDATTDYDGAQEAGVHFIGRVPPEETNTFAKFGSVKIIDNLKELEKAILEI